MISFITAEEIYKNFGDLTFEIKKLDEKKYVFGLRRRVVCSSRSITRTILQSRKPFKTKKEILFIVEAVLNKTLEFCNPEDEDRFLLTKEESEKILKGLEENNIYSTFE